MMTTTTMMMKVAGGNGNDDGNYGRRWNTMPSQIPLSPFTGEEDFTHSTQDEDYGCMAAGEGVGVIGKQHIRIYGVAQMSQTDEDSIALSLDSMSLGTE